MICKAVAIAVFAISIFSLPAFAERFDFSAWNSLLREHVINGAKEGVSVNLVDYPAIARDARFKKTVEALALHKPSFADKKSKIAFWSNAYNILAIKMVIDHPAIKSIRDIGSFFSPVWKKVAGKVGGRDYTLDHIEHKILRRLSDPRIHAAIVCASVSCPDLMQEAYDAQKLDKQLDGQWRLFLANRGKGLSIDTKAKKIYISSIFKWFEEDFKKGGGVRKFISQYVSPKLASLVNNRSFGVEYMSYNWNLNSK